MIRNGTVKGKLLSGWLLTRERLCLSPSINKRSGMSSGYQISYFQVVWGEGMGQECWSGLPFPSPGDLLNLGLKPGSPAL